MSGAEVIGEIRLEDETLRTLGTLKHCLGILVFQLHMLIVHLLTREHSRTVDAFEDRGVSMSDFGVSTEIGIGVHDLATLAAFVDLRARIRNTTGVRHVLLNPHVFVQVAIFHTGNVGIPFVRIVNAMILHVDFQSANAAEHAVTYNAGIDFHFEMNTSVLGQFGSRGELLIAKSASIVLRIRFVSVSFFQRELTRALRSAVVLPRAAMFLVMGEEIAGRSEFGVTHEARELLLLVIDRDVRMEFFKHKESHKAVYALVCHSGFRV